MTEVTPKDVQTMLRSYLHNRSDLGIRKAIAAHIFEPRNPFEPQTVRKPQRWFALFVFASLMAIGAFVYFSFRN
jgi:hypothetical protein